MILNFWGAFANHVYIFLYVFLLYIIFSYPVSNCVYIKAKALYKFFKFTTADYTTTASKLVNNKSGKDQKVAKFSYSSWRPK